MLIVDFCKWDIDANIRINYKKIWEAIKRLPAPKRGSYLDIVPRSDDTVLCLEQEIVYICSDKKFGETKRYIGSKSVNTCILIYLRTPLDHLLIHLNVSSTIPDLSPYLALFRYRGDVTVTLTGDARSNPEIQNLCLDVLVLAAKTLAALGFNLIVESALLGVAIKISDEYKLKSVAEKLEEQLKIVCHYWYGRRVDSEIFSAEKRNALISNLKNNSVKNEDLQKKIYHILTLAKYVYETRSSMEMEEFAELNKLKTFSPDEGYFINLVENYIFDKGLFNFYNCQGRGIFPDIELEDTIYSIQTGTLYLINSNLRTGNEEIRNMLLLERDDYFFAYSTYIGYLTPKIKNSFNKKINSIVNGKTISSRTQACTQLGHPTSDPAIAENIIGKVYRYQACLNSFYLTDEIEDYFGPKIYQNFIDIFYQKPLSDSQAVLILKKELKKLLGHSKNKIMPLVRKSLGAGVKDGAGGEVDIVIDVEHMESARKIQNFLSAYQIPVFLISCEKFLNKRQLQLWLLSVNVNTSQTYNGLSQLLKQ